MFTWGSRNLFGVALLAWIGALFYGLTTGGHLVGVLSMGYKHGVGDHVGYTILMGAAFVALLLGVISVTTRDGNSEDMSALVGVEHSLAVRPPSRPAYWGPLAGLGLACIALGVATSQAFLYLGVAVIVIVIFEWGVLAWSDRATGDAEVNSVIRSRLLSPFEVPILALLGAAFVVLGLSRVLLTVSEVMSVVVVSVAATLVFATAIFIAKARPPRSIISGIIAFGAVAVLAGGIIGAANGERDFHHGEEHAEEADH